MQNHSFLYHPHPHDSLLGYIIGVFPQRPHDRRQRNGLEASGVQYDRQWIWPFGSCLARNSEVDKLTIN